MRLLLPMISHHGLLNVLLILIFFTMQLTLYPTVWINAGTDGANAIAIILSCLGSLGGNSML